MQTETRRFHRSAAALIALGFATGQIAGCTNVGGGNVELSAEPGDPCAQYRADFASSKTYFTDQIVSGALTGGAVGAIGGGLVGLATGGTRGLVTGLLVGGAAGAIAGGTSAYYDNLKQHARDQQELASGINSDLNREVGQLDHVNATFAQLRECRFAAAQQIKYQVRTGQIARPAAIAALDTERRLFDQEIEVARQYGATMQKRDDQFQVAAQNLAKSDPNYTPPSGGSSYSGSSSSGSSRSSSYSSSSSSSSSSRSRSSSSRSTSRSQPSQTSTQQAVTTATETIPEKRASFASSVDDASTKSKVAFNIDSSNPA